MHAFGYKMEITITVTDKFKLSSSYSSVERHLPQQIGHWQRLN